MELDYFPCFNSYRRKVAKLSDQEVGRLFRALMDYSATGERQELTGRESVAFDFIADDIDRAKENYRHKCEQNSERVKKRWQKQALPANTDVYHGIPTHTDEHQLYKSKSKDKDKNKNNSSPNGEENACAPAHAREPASAVVSAYTRKINPMPSSVCIAELVGFAEDLGEELCLKAIDIALDANARDWRYIRAILADWRRNSYKTTEDVDRAEFSRRGGKNGLERNCANDSAKDSRKKWNIESKKLD